MKKMISVLLAFILLVTMSVPAFAESSDYLGTDDDITGEIIPDDSQDSNLGRATNLPIQIGDGGLDRYAEIFTITAANVTNLLPSSVGAKSFNPAMLLQNATTIIGIAELYHCCMYGDEETG